MNKDNESLEKLIHQTLRGTAGPKAPASLEQRILAQIAREARRPWWQQSFHQWPTSARLAFLASSAGVVAFMAVGGIELYRHGVAPGVSSWWSKVASSGQALIQVASHQMDSMPSSVAYALAGAGVVLLSAFLVTLGCGAAAYRLLWKNS